MSKLSDRVDIAIKTLHLLTDKEWISLKEIYEEIKKQNGSGRNIDSATIRDAIEKGCKISDKFLKDEKFISKKKYSGLYKSVHYDQIKYINDLNIGEIFSWEQLKSIFKVSGQGGIMKTNTLNCLVLTTDEENGVYVDGSIEDGRLIYTAQGLSGDQTITRNNKSVYESRETDLPMFLFSKDKDKNYIFEGRVELYADPYQVAEEGNDKLERLVWKFPLKIVYPDHKDEYNDSIFKEVVNKVAKITKDIDIEEDDEDDLIFKEGPLKIRKYRKTDKKNKRNSKPDYIASQIIKSKRGIINEKKIYKHELKQLEKEGAKQQIKEMKEFFENKKENEGYDILTFQRDGNGQYVKKYIEVKSTVSSESTPIDITADEVKFISEHKDEYYLYRVVFSDSSKKYVKIVNGHDILNDYEFVPTAYKIYSK